MGALLRTARNSVPLRVVTDSASTLPSSSSARSRVPSGETEATHSPTRETVAGRSGRPGSQKLSVSVPFQRGDCVAHEKPRLREATVKAMLLLVRGQAGLCAPRPQCCLCAPRPSPQC